MGNFRFLDDTDAQRILGVDRLTFQELLRTKRLRAISGAGTIQFFRAADVSRLHDELAAESASQAAVSAAAVAATPSEVAPMKKTKKTQEPAMRVHARFTADLRWYDITDADIQAWFDQLHPETYARRRGVAQFVRQRMDQIVALLDAGEARYTALVEGEEAAGRGGEAADALQHHHEEDGH